VNAYRTQADTAIRLPRDQRNAALLKTFVPAMTDTVNAGLKVWFSALYATAEHDPQLERLATIKELGWRLRDLSGQERATIAAVIATDADLSRDVWATVLEYRARVSVLWDELQNLTVESNTDPAIVEAMRGARQGYFQNFLSLSNDMKKLSDSGREYTITAAQWVDKTTPQVGSFLNILHAASRVSEARAKGTAARSLRNLVWICGLLLFGIAVAAASIWIVVVRVTRPLSAISDVLMQLAGGNKSVDVPYTSRRDEIGENARAAQSFKESLLRMEQLEADQKAIESRTAAEREAAMQRMASEFEEAVGGIVRAAVAGDFSQRVEVHGKTGMVLNVGTALNALCENTGRALDELMAMLNALAKGDLTRRITAEYEGNFAVLRDNANKTADEIGAIITEIKLAVRELTNASSEIAASSTDLSQRTEEQAASLEETSASMDRIAAIVKKNAENAQTASRSSSGTREVADRGGRVVDQAVEAMSRIEDSSQKIADIIGVIDEIARQTNLLALNAAVEAARAGDAGRGFAVVASEVRSLAQRSSQAAKDIKDLIINSSGQVKEGVDLVNRAGAALTEIVESVKSVAVVVADIATASVEQATGIEQVNKALTQMDEVTQQNSALVEENAATAKTLETQASAMGERVAFFHIAEAEDSRPQRPVRLVKPGDAGTVKSGRVAAPAARPGAVKAPRRATASGSHTALATAFDSEWKDF
jgi:methyl-accepting chemotaxis protein